MSVLKFESRAASRQCAFQRTNNHRPLSMRKEEKEKTFLEALEKHNSDTISAA